MLLTSHIKEFAWQNSWPAKELEGTFSKDAPTGSISIENVCASPASGMPTNKPSWFGIQGLGFGAWGLGFGVWGLGFGGWGVGFGVRGLGFGVWGLGLGIWGLRFEVWGLGFGVWDLGFGDLGSGRGV